MPTRAALAPRARPKNLAIFRCASFPKREVRDRFLFVFIATDALANTHLVKIQFDQLTVLDSRGTILFDAEIDRTIGGFVGVAALHELFDERNDFGNMLSGARRLVRDSAVKRLEIIEKGIFEF